MLESVRPWLEGERAQAGANSQGASSTLPRVGLCLLFGVGRAADEDAVCSGQEEPQLWTLYIRGPTLTFFQPKPSQRAKNLGANTICSFKAHDPLSVPHFRYLGT